MSALAGPRPPSPLLGVLTVVLTVTGWASIPLFLRHFADAIDPWTSNGWRYGFSALVWAPVLVLTAMRGSNGGRGRGARRTPGGLPAGLWRAAIVPSIVNAAGQVCFTAAHYVIDPALLTFGLRTQLLFVAIGAWIMFPKERAIIRTPGYLVGAGLLVVGMVAVIALNPATHDPGNTSIRANGDIAQGSNILERAESSTSSRAMGDVATGSEPMTNTAHASTSDMSQTSAAVASATHSSTSERPARGTLAAHIAGVALALVSGMLFAAYGLSVRKYMEGVHPVLAFAAICQYTAAALVTLMLVFGDRCGLTVFDMSAAQMFWLLISALIGIAIGHVFYYISIARLGVAVTAGVLQLQPFLVAVGSISLFGERLTSGQWIGGFIAVAGALLMLYVQWRMSSRVAKIEEPLAVAEGEGGA